MPIYRFFSSFPCWKLFYFLLGYGAQWAQRTRKRLFTALFDDEKRGTIGAQWGHNRDTMVHNRDYSNDFQRSDSFLTARGFTKINFRRVPLHWSSISISPMSWSWNRISLTAFTVASSRVFRTNTCMLRMSVNDFPL